MKVDDKGLVYLRVVVNGIPRDNEAEIIAILKKYGYELKQIKNKANDLKSS